MVWGGGGRGGGGRAISPDETLIGRAEMFSLFEPERIFLFAIGGINHHCADRWQPPSWTDAILILSGFFFGGKSNFRLNNGAEERERGGNHYGCSFYYYVRCSICSLEPKIYKLRSVQLLVVQGNYI
jgi:hypothetical protein